MPESSSGPAAALRHPFRPEHRNAYFVKRIAERARSSQKVTQHVLRHPFATMALQKGISLAAVQKILGHERLGTTALYLNLTDLHVVEEYAQKW